MFFVTLTFGANRGAAPRFLAAHKAWIAQGFSDGVFLLTGSLADGSGGAVLAHATSRESLDARLAADPFVAEGIVAADVVEVAPGMTDARLAFLGPQSA
jgi:uncharacterized protein YciI